MLSNSASFNMVRVTETKVVLCLTFCALKKGLGGLARDSLTGKAYSEAKHRDADYQIVKKIRCLLCTAKVL